MVGSGVVGYGRVWSGRVRSGEGAMRNRKEKQ